MVLRLLTVGLALIVFATSAQAQEKEKSKLDAKKLEGEWKLVSGKRAGADSADEVLAATIEIKDEKITLTAGPDAVFVMGFKIDASETPAHIDMKILEGPAPEGSPAVGIVQYKDGKLKLCYNATGGDRPEKFESTEDNECFLFEMKRAKKEEDK